MIEFLSQFTLLEDYAVLHQDLKKIAMLEEAKKLGYVKDWVPRNGSASCSYYKTAIITLKGLSYLKRNRQSKDQYVSWVFCMSVGCFVCQLGVL